MIVYIPAALYAKFIAQIPTRLLRDDSHVPRGRPLQYPELGRRINYKERYMIQKWRKQGISEALIKQRILKNADSTHVNSNLGV